MSTAAPNYPYYNCDFVRQLPFEGAEILIVSAVFLFFIVNFAVSFFSVVVKQIWPSSLDPVVANRLIEIQRLFPNIVNSANPSSDDEHDSESSSSSSPVVPVKTHTLMSESGEPIQYDAVASAEAYISTKSVDEDLLFVLANNGAYGTVSEYCTCTTRGYAMLSTMLMTSGMCLSFLWVHNVIVDPTLNNDINKLALIGYCLIFLTGMVMTGPSQMSVVRNANIWLTTNIPLNGTPRKMLTLHDIGVVGFCLVPLISHLLTALFNKDKMPNYHETMAGIGMQLFGAILFGACSLGGKIAGFTKLDGLKYGIAAECFVVLASYLAFIRFEYYATAACANQLTYYNGLLIGALFAPFAFIARHFCWAPTSFTSAPSLLLMYQGQPVAQYGPAPAIAFNASTFNPDGKSVKDLPRVKVDADAFKM